MTRKKKSHIGFPTMKELGIEEDVDSRGHHRGFFLSGNLSGGHTKVGRCKECGKLIHWKQKKKLWVCSHCGHTAKD